MAEAGSPAALHEALCARRESDRHRSGLFEELLQQYGLPTTWGAECAARFHEHPGTELPSVPSLRCELDELRSKGYKIALVTNGGESLQKRKLRLLGFEGMFDICIYCDPSRREHLKPSVWGWDQLLSWRAGLPAGYVGDDPVDARFAEVGRARFIRFAFRNNRYEN